MVNFHEIIHKFWEYARLNYVLYNWKSYLFGKTWLEFRIMKINKLFRCNKLTLFWRVNSIENCRINKLLNWKKATTCFHLNSSNSINVVCLQITLETNNKYIKLGTNCPISFAPGCFIYYFSVWFFSLVSFHTIL